MLFPTGHLTWSPRKPGFQRVSKRCFQNAVNDFMLFSESSDPEFDDYNSHFSSLEQATEKLLKDTKAYADAVTGMQSCRRFYLLSISILHL